MIFWSSVGRFARGRHGLLANRQLQKNTF